MATRKKLKKEVYLFIGLIIVIVGGVIFGINKFKEYQYHKTNEYKLLNLGYSNDEVDFLLDLNDDEIIKYVLSQEKNSKIINILNEKYFLTKNFNLYIEYMNNNKDLSSSEIVRNINIHLDKNFYEDTEKANITLDTTLLVNKHYLLDKDYIPDDLVNVSQNYAWGEVGSQKVRVVAYNAFLDMWNAANEEGYYLMINSSYRSYEDQEIVYNNYKNSSGERFADSIAARPGSSEHQTGLALDIFSKTNTNKNTFSQTDEAKWLKENAHNYGFILRYPEDKVDITGYSFESWHYRYVGVDIATYIYENDITYEEYYAYFLED